MAMTGIIVDIMVEVLKILAIATKEIKQRRSSESIDRRLFVVLNLVFFRKVFEKAIGQERN
jgi:hypothetical protein